MFKSFLSKLFSSEPKYEPFVRQKAHRPPAAAQEAPADPASAALLRAIEERRKIDPLVGAKMGGKEIFARLLRGLQNERGVHVETLLCAAGALAGYACQAGLRSAAGAQGYSEKDVFTIVEAGGKKFYFGDHLNKPLCESQYSVWSLAAGAAQSNGCKELPDLHEIFKHVAASVGEPTFGIPRIPEGHQPGEKPVFFVKLMWPIFEPIVKEFCPDPFEWPIMFGSAIAQVLDFSKTVIAPDLALRIVMESAVPMSKVDLSAE
ncbi:MAG: hypothetical protein V4631_18005 [Pseudomonadota bacterium]